ncbi:MAG: hypothetical protein UHL07_03735, partial [Bacteroidaceae bacterium]|nr:hypothetical protein [Bacteroidaceae bacterium]
KITETAKHFGRYFQGKVVILQHNKCVYLGIIGAKIMKAEGNNKKKLTFLLGLPLCWGLLGLFQNCLITGDRCQQVGTPLCG